MNARDPIERQRPRGLAVAVFAHAAVLFASSPAFCASPAPDLSQPASGPGAEGRVVGASGYALRRVPAGTALIGCTPGQGDACQDDERPAREVVLSHAILVGEVEVTQGLYQRLMGSNPSKFSACGPTCPVEQVSWFDAVAFANTLSAAEGFEPCYVIDGASVSWPKGPSCLGYRLPTEAEWEVAARGGRDERYAGGPELGAVGWYASNSGGQTHPVGEKAPNGYGLCDMSGNVWEWAWDWYDSSAYAGGVATDPSGPASGVSRVFRGGGWSNDPQIARVESRGISSPGFRDNSLGLRLIRTAG